MKNSYNSEQQGRPSIASIFAPAPLSPLAPNKNITNISHNPPRQTLGSTFKREKLLGSNGRTLTKPKHKRSTSTLSFSRHMSLSTLFNEKYTTDTAVSSSHTATTNNTSTATAVQSHNTKGSGSGLSLSPRKRTLSSSMDRFIPSSQSSVSKLTLNKTVSLPAFALPQQHISEHSMKVYQSSVAKACGLDVGQRILQFRPQAPLSRSNSTTTTSSNSGNGNNTNVEDHDLGLGLRSMISPQVALARMKSISTTPTKVLDAPGLIDDFYLNLIAWSNDNLLGIALGKDVYVWNAQNGVVQMLTSCACEVSSIQWSQDGYYLSVGLNDGSLELYDMETQAKVRSIKGHHNVRVGVHDWNEHIIASGDRNGVIQYHDVRISQSLISKMDSGYHYGEVCGLKWRSDGLQLASGGNDNLVNVWDCRKSVPIYTKTAHNAAVKALSWCPDQLNLLASGGGQACKRIHFWNTSLGSRVNTMETNSQVSGIHWGYTNGVGKEIVTTHGHSDNEIGVWAYPSLQRTAVIQNSHESRILGSCLSPDGSTLATIAGDENLKFWKIWEANSLHNQQQLTLHNAKQGSAMTHGKGPGVIR